MRNKKFKQIIFDYSSSDSDEEICDYFKLKFEDRELTDYEFLLWMKVFFYIKIDEEHARDKADVEHLDIILKEYNLPIPTNFKTSEDLFDKIKAHEWIKLQDNTGKYLFGPATKAYLNIPSFWVNRSQRSLNVTIAKLKDIVATGDLGKEFADKTRWMEDAAKGLSYFVARYFQQIYKRCEREMSETARKRTFPFANIEKACNDIDEIINVLCYIYEHPEENKGEIRQDCLFAVAVAKLFELKAISGFIALCSFLVDGMFFSFDYKEALLEIAMFLQLQFHNSSLYSIEIPVSKPNLSKPVEERGMSDHTTLMKIYLFDNESTPRVIRIDMPHVGAEGEQYLHFNVFPDKENEKYDHSIITKNIEGIETVLDSIREAMQRECPNLIRFQDSTRDDDKMVLREMEQFNKFDDLTYAYVMHKDVENALSEYNTIMCTKHTSAEDALFEGGMEFYNLI